MNLRHAFACLQAAATAAVELFRLDGRPVTPTPGAPLPDAPVSPGDLPLPEPIEVATEIAMTPIGGGATTVTAPPPAANKTSKVVPPDNAAGKSAPAPRPDQDFDRLLARSAKLQGQKLDLGARLADMERRVREFEQRQYAALNDILGECLRLRLEYARLKADHSGEAADFEQARSAADDFESYHGAAEARPAALPELDEDERDELRRLYRTAASRCHPDRASEAEQAAAHARFLSVQAAYRANDLGSLREILAELDARPMSPAAGSAGSRYTGSDPIRRQVGELQDQVADLILAIQTLQLNSVYRQAANVDDWDTHFARARRGFEQECAALRSHIRRFAVGVC